MVDTTEAMESKYLTADVVKDSREKRLTFKDEGMYEDTDYGRRLTFTIEIDGKEKIYRPNRDSVSNISGAFGKDSKLWFGKSAKLQLVKIQGKDSIIAMPVVIQEEKVE